MSRELTHLVAATRISAPIGVRQALWLIKSQAEHEAGVKSAVAPWWHQIFWAIAAFASFAWIFGWQDALLLMGVVAVHEVGHALAMLWFGLGVRFISFIPFFGGVAAPKRYYEDEWQKGIVALMGVGFSLPFTAGLLWYAIAYDHALAAHAAAMSAFVNGFNLLPIPGLDGSAVTQILLRPLPRIVGRIVQWLFLALFVAMAALINAPIVWVAVAFSVIVLVQSSSLKLDEHLGRLSWPGWLAVLVLLVGFFAAYVWLGYHAALLDR